MNAYLINFVDMHTLPHQQQVDRKGVGILLGTRPFYADKHITYNSPLNRGLCSCDHHRGMLL